MLEELFDDTRFLQLLFVQQENCIKCFDLLHLDDDQNV
jgi:hypothetical protein